MSSKDRCAATARRGFGSQHLKPLARKGGEVPGAGLETYGQIELRRMPSLPCTIASSRVIASTAPYNT